MDKMPKSHIDKIIGPYKDKEGVVNFLDKLGKDKIGGEIEKTPRDKELIDFSQKCLDEYLSEFRENNIYEIPEEKIHILPIGGVMEFTNGKINQGVSNSTGGAIAIDRNINDITFSIVLFHEMYHVKVFSSINIDENSYYDERRSGFTTYVNGEKYFGLINETLNDYFCKRFFSEKIKNSNLFNKNDIDNYVLKTDRVKLLDLFEKTSEELFEKNKDQFNSKEEIKKLFFDADINGSLLPIARLIEKTYGEGAFRKLGENMKN